MTGTVAKLCIDKGYFFIKPDDGTTGVFAHVKQLDQDIPFDETLTERRLAFDVEDTMRGRRASNIRAAD